VFGKIYGAEKSYYEGEELQSKTYYKDSKKTGIATLYYQNGEISEYGKYNQDKLNGKYYKYFLNGMLKSEIEYDEGNMISEINYNEEGGKITASK